MFLNLFNKLNRLPDKTQVNAVFWSGAILVGLAAVGLAAVADLASTWFTWIQSKYWWSPLLILPAGGMLVLWIMRTAGPGANGSGIPQAKAALALVHEQETVTRSLLSIRIALVKAAGIVLGLASGFVLGREGPTVQIGASIMFSMRRFLPFNTEEIRKKLILVGGAAGIAAAFNTPLAGIVFAFEEMARSFEEKTSGKLLGAVIVAGVVSLAVEGDYTYFGRINAAAFSAQEVLPVVLVGILCGVIGGAFSWLCLNTDQWLPSAVINFKSAKPYLFVAICGALIACLGVFAPIHGSGAEVTKEAIENQHALPWYFMPIKFVGILLTFLTGLPGGIFAPSLALGAGVGSWFAPYFASGMIVKLMAVGMAAMLAAVTRAPVTAAVIMIEMTDGHSMVISILVATLVSSTLARFFNANLYHGLAARAINTLSSTHRV